MGEGHEENASSAVKGGRKMYWTEENNLKLHVGKLANGKQQSLSRKRDPETGLSSAMRPALGFDHGFQISAPVSQSGGSRSNVAATCFNFKRLPRRFSGPSCFILSVFFSLCELPLTGE